jgi:hypothetical protein
MTYVGHRSIHSPPLSGTMNTERLSSPFTAQYLAGTWHTPEGSQEYKTVLSIPLMAQVASIPKRNDPPRIHRKNSHHGRYSSYVLGSPRIVFFRE